MLFYGAFPSHNVLAIYLFIFFLAAEICNDSSLSESEEVIGKLVIMLISYIQ